MIRLVALFGVPEDEGLFREKYEMEHLPLARQMPGILSLVHHPVAMVAGGGVFHMAELVFPDRRTLDVAMVSPEGRNAARSLRGLGASVTMFIVEGGPGET